jgi:hypothetical protein
MREATHICVRLHKEGEQVRFGIWAFTLLCSLHKYSDAPGNESLTYAQCLTAQRRRSVSKQLHAFSFY